ncbi:hypothetical protein NM04_14940 [Massilia aurea]|uniref:Uncharacterized protein n=1 Tax=Massilia aurea TaxID=373040 RepID=A0A422QJ75_9BURK|nr:hypothetical protein [Massilia aurea]RNF30032.1 hypothetical protein NM04_14940 [Massilia aurea]
MFDQNVSQAAERKRVSSKAAYVKDKLEREHALLRFRPGSLAKLDAARAAMGLSRSAYVEILLGGIELTPSIASNSTGEQSTCSIGDEFEALFGGGA